MTTSERRLFLPLMVKVSAGLPWNAEDKRHANELLRALAPTATPKYFRWVKEKKQKQLSKNEELAAIKEYVAERAGLCCENPLCASPFSERRLGLGSLDH